MTILLDCAPSLQSYRQRLESFLEKQLSFGSDTLFAAMRYSTLKAGKRLRPLLIYAAGVDLGVPVTQLDAAAAAIGLIHCYSLIHDDLPAMDNDALRRGQATTHIKFDEATAILAGDALGTLAFEVLSDAPLAAEIRCQLIKLVSHAAGATQMIYGQAQDLAASGQQPTLNSLTQIHQLKTGALIQCAFVMAATIAQVEAPVMQSIAEIGQQLGICFQIQDDLLEATSDTQTLGKNTDSDRNLNKATFPRLLGCTKTKQLLDQHCSQLQIRLAELPIHTPQLSQLFTIILHRQYWPSVVILLVIQ